MSKKITLGTKEWADSNINCYFGCSNDCRYCYAKKMAIRFRRKTKENWKIMEPNQQKIEKGYKKRKGRLMFPTSHDITEESIDNCIIVMKKLLKAKNNILITTKPRFECIKRICNTFIEYRDQIQFRFTITSFDDDLLKFWEPNAPLLEERLKSLKFAFNQGFKTSVSIEPFLDKDPYALVDKLLPYITESIWIGKMNYVKKNSSKINEKKYYELIREINSRENLINILNKAKIYKNKKLRIKDSIYNYLLEE